MATVLVEKDFQAIGSINQFNEVEPEVFGEKVGLFASLFGCWHKRITRPFMAGKVAYRACLDCGARKRFNTDTLETDGKFYYPPIVKRVKV